MKKFKVTLTADERQTLRDLTGGSSRGRTWSGMCRRGRRSATSVGTRSGGASRRRIHGSSSVAYTRFFKLGGTLASLGNELLLSEIGRDVLFRKQFASEKATSPRLNLAHGYV